ncbi:MAG TPA: DedA family protein [Pseudonocardiaceae bacterium]
MTDWISGIIDRLGPLGVALIIALENIIPPIPSEVVLPLAGYRAREGAMDPFLVWIGATAGALAGALVLYGLGHWLGYDRLHRLAGHRWFFIVGQKDLERGEKLFQRHGSWIVAAARCVPVVRSVVSVPAGICGMPLVRFSLLTVLGSGVWNALFIGAGWALADRWEVIDRYSGPVGMVVAVLLVAGLGVLAWRRHREAATARSG